MLDFKNYIASDGDLKAIEEGIDFVWHPKLSFILKDKRKISPTIVISYDSNNIYLFQDRELAKIPHRLKIKKELHSWWRTGLLPESIGRYLPARIRGKSRFESPIISGGLLTPFIELQQQKSQPYNPYVTRESYLATIIHEFAHIYWDQHKLWWYSNKEENLSYLEESLGVFCGKEVSKLKLMIPSPVSLGEIFAFCVEYFVSEVFFKEHKKNVDKFYSERLRGLIKFERNKNLDKENSVLDTEPPHDLAATVGILLLKYYPKSWPQKILNYRYFP